MPDHNAALASRDCRLWKARMVNSGRVRFLDRLFLVRTFHALHC